MTRHPRRAAPVHEFAHVCPGTGIAAFKAPIRAGSRQVMGEMPVSGSGRLKGLPCSRSSRPDTGHFDAGAAKGCMQHPGGLD